VTTRPDSIAAAFKWACFAELEAPKPGNVHVFADGHRMTTGQFVASAEAAAPSLSAEGTGVGARILGAVEATCTAVGANTNLGIILLCAPLGAAADAGTAGLRAALVNVLHGLDVEDANLAFRAIARASPAGLGRSARYDVFEPATVSLLRTMQEASDRDRIAKQYATDFADVFDVGLPTLEAAHRQYADQRWATLATYLGFLAAFPDTHILRKFGLPTAKEVQLRAATFQGSLHATERPAGLVPELLAWDAALKADGVNPGTSADLTVATLFAHRLKCVLPSFRNSD
jgi:triphosphoribosyl-dephospho-CoA synthase